MELKIKTEYKGDGKIVVNRNDKEFIYYSRFFDDASVPVSDIKEKGMPIMEVVGSANWEAFRKIKEIAEGYSVELFRISKLSNYGTQANKVDQELVKDIENELFE